MGAGLWPVSQKDETRACGLRDKGGMFTRIPANPLTLAAACAVLSVTFFSFNDMAIKFLSGGYALHEVVLIRSLIGLGFVLAFIIPFSGGRAALRTRRLPLHLLRGLLVVASNMFFFLGLAAMPLAEAVAIFFVCPVLVTLFSVIFLRETVGRHRWMAAFLGLAGVIVMMRPGTESFTPASLLPLGSAVAYAGMHMLTRTIGRTEGPGTLAFYIQLTFVLVSLSMGLFVGDGHLAEGAGPSLSFLFREWIWPAPGDYLILFGIGIASAVGGYFISVAYRAAPAAFVAPFEYFSLVLSVFWGLVVFDEWPDLLSFVGITMILSSGLYTLWREKVAAPVPVAEAPQMRR